jgi:ABC-2 type transport system ATP-binding protein
MNEHWHLRAVEGIGGEAREKPDLMLELRGLTKCYGTHRALDDLNLAVARGEVFGLLGPNGAGKTTTMRIITTLALPTSGVALIDGLEVSRRAWWVKKEIGVVCQVENLDLQLTAWENLELHARLYKVNKAERGDLIREMLAFVELEDRADVPVMRFSGGMKRRLMIARALLHRPRLLFLDEPTVGLDPQVRRKIWDLIRSLNGKGITVFLTTHYIEEAELLCHRVGILNRGRLIALGTPEELKARLGKVVVEAPNNGVTEYRIFESREQAIAYMGSLDQTMVIRKSSLEDVFVELTGSKVGD